MKRAKDITLENGMDNKGVERGAGKEIAERPEKRREPVKSGILESKGGNFKEEAATSEYCSMD